MKQSAKTALGGIVSALSLTLMLLTAVIPFLTYALPAFSGLLLLIIVIELNKKWAFGTYVAVSILSLLLLPDKEAAMMYVAFFGYYPIVKPVFESRLSKIPECICKFLTFNVSVIIAYLVIIYVFGLSMDDLDDFGKWSIPILLGAGNVVFILYDYMLSLTVTVYLKRWQKKFRSIFKSR